MELLFFYRDGCAPCDEVKPRVEAFAERHGINLIRIDARRDVQGAVQHYGVRAAPTVVLVGPDGAMLGRLFGLLINERTLEKLIS